MLSYLRWRFLCWCPKRWLRTRPVLCLRRQHAMTRAQVISAWQILRDLSGTVEGPTDWAAEADHYLYGTPKRSDRLNKHGTNAKG